MIWKLLMKNENEKFEQIFADLGLFKATVKSFFQKKSEFFFLHHIMQLSMTFPKN